MYERTLSTRDRSQVGWKKHTVFSDELVVRKLSMIFLDKLVCREFCFEELDRIRKLGFKNS